MSNRPLRTTRSNVTNLQQRPGWYQIKAQAAGPARVDIYDEIGFMAVSADSFIRDVAAISGDIELHLNSPGGDVFDGIAIYNNLRQRPGRVSVVVDGLAASAASFIAQAASPGCLAMAPHSQMMIHDGFGMAIGNAADMRQMAGLLDKASDNIAGIYADRSGKPAAYWRDKMRAETWLDDHEAVAEGLADHVLGQEQPQNAWDLSVYLNAPVVVNADGNHAPMTGIHTHAHPAYGTAGHEAHEHSHDGDASHDHEHYDPDHDGDDDASAAGDTDHDYVLPDGKPGPKAGNHWHARLSNADKYNADDRKRMAGNGHAMPDGSYPIEDEEDLDNAIHAVGRGGADHDAIRRHVIKRAKALGKSDAIPDNWNADGSLKTSADNLSEAEILAMFAGELHQLGAGRE
jgi:ATP-dependent Clp endopeptidase proteolytic subunit ClpP